jgi:hypothetical protein
VWWTCFSPQFVAVISCKVDASSSFLKSGQRRKIRRPAGANPRRRRTHDHFRVRNASRRCPFNTVWECVSGTSTVWCCAVRGTQVGHERRPYVRRAVDRTGMMGCLLGNFEEISSLLRGGLRRAVHARSNLLQHQHLNSSSIYARVGIEMAAIFAQSNQVFIILGESVHPLFVPSRRCSLVLWFCSYRFAC